MNWSKVKLIFLREMRDQLRDRRTLFMIGVLPLCLYPLMGMAYFQVAQFLRENPTQIAVLGAEDLPSDPPLIEDGHFAETLFSQPSRAKLLVLKICDQPVAAEEVAEWSQAMLDHGQFDAVVYFPPDFSSRINVAEPGNKELDVPRPRVFFTGAKDRSRVAYERIVSVLDHWRAAVVSRTLQSHDLPAAAATPFQTWDQDVAASSGRRAAMWSKILPFVLILWALTGAFYPAIDLCAGEKERGTLETLLCAPAERIEIVWGKLLTVIVFSVSTSVLNLVSLVTTGAAVLGRMNLGDHEGLGPPPLSVLCWMVAALIPLSAIFSALSLALATMARSTKEGQYYLMPLMLAMLPLSMIAVFPTTEIGLGNSLIPVAGVMMLLRTAIEGDYLLAMRYVGPATLVTGVCCWLSIRWAVNLFSNESVLFRENERFAMGVWLKHLVRDRGVTPSAAEGFMCGVLLLVLQFFARLFAPMPTNWTGFWMQTLVVQAVFVAIPAGIMAWVLTANPRRSLLLEPTRWTNVAVALLLALIAHPASMALTEMLQTMYPISADAEQSLGQIGQLLQGVPLWQVVLLLAITPAVCEELAFRGFILSGLRHLGNKTLAILISSLFFGVMHAFLQQSIHAFLLGLLLGYIAVQTGSLLPTMAFHAVHNGLSVVLQAAVTPESLQLHPVLRCLFMESTHAPGTVVFQRHAVLLSVLAASLLIAWLRSLPFCPSPEERLQSAIEHQNPATA